ncbi:MAG: caspase family protein [Cyanobacteria bacterium P01_F01_bin.53]
MSEFTAEPAAKIHALLIGINHYPANRFYKPLKGCVRDINLVDDYLQTSFNIPSEDIYRLISETPKKKTETTAGITTEESPKETVSIEGNPKQGEATYENIVRAFTDITNSAKAGDQIYIHYCGHGGRATTRYPELKGEGQNDEGLVPTDIGTAGHYVRDIEMATLLKRMTDKGMMVTMVLDSCHSGGATRGDCGVRGSSEVDTDTKTAESLVASREELLANWRSLTDGSGPTNSSASRQTNWIPESPQYVVLAACRPSELAFEYVVNKGANGKERHGALTYWMIDTLTTFGNEISYRALHDRVSAKIQSKFPAQLPMLMGDAERIILESDRKTRPYTATVLGTNAESSSVSLSAGQPQGTTRGARFAIYPLSTQDFTDKSLQQAIVEITKVGASQSSARILPATEGGLGDVQTISQISQGSPALKLSTPVDLLRKVRLYDQKTLGNGDNELPENLVSQQTSALEAVRQAIANNGWVTEITEEDQESDYQVSIGPAGEYEICVGMPLKNLTPPLMIDDPNAPQKIVNRLVHLAKYQAVQALDNPGAAIATELTYELLDEHRNPLPPANPVALKNGGKIYLRLCNTGPKPLNIALLDLEPTWAISQVHIQGIESPFYQLSSKETLDTPLRFKLPQTSQYQQAKEILKIFATRGPADFRLLRLPSLDEELQNKPEAATRSLGSPFSKLLEAVGGDPAIAPALSRAVVYDSAPEAEWATHQVQLVVGD